MLIREIVEQLKKCDFECKGGKLEDNLAFKELEKITNAPVAQPYHDETEIYTLPVLTFSTQAPWDAEWEETVVFKDMRDVHKLLEILEKNYGIKNNHIIKD